MKKKIIILSLIIMLPLIFLAVLYAIESFIQVQIKERHHISTAKFQIAVEEDQYYHSIIIPSGSSSFSFTVYNRGEVSTFYDILFRSSQTLEIEHFYGASQIIQNQTFVYSKQEDALETGASKMYTVHFTDVVAEEITIDVIALYRATYKQDNQLVAQPNYYLSSDYDLKKVLHSVSFNRDIDNVQQYARMVLLDDIIIEEKLLINLPITLDLLYSNLILNAEVEIRHHAYGTYYFHTISGKIQNQDHWFLLRTPNAFHQTYLLDGQNFTTLFEQPNHVVTTYAPTNEAQAEELMTEAKAYFESLFVWKDHDKIYLIDDIIIPKQYFCYDIYFELTSFYHKISEIGRVSRNVDTNMDTLTVKIASPSLKKEINTNYMVEIIGTSHQAVFEFTIFNLRNNLSNIQKKGALQHSVMLPQESQFDPEMILNYQVSDSDFVLLENTMHGVRLSQTKFLVEQKEIQLLVDNEFGNTATIPIVLRAMNKEERKHALANQVGSFVFLNSKALPLLTEEVKHKYGIKTISYELVLYRDGEVVDTTSSEYLEYRNKIILSETTVEIQDVNSFVIATNHKLFLEMKITWQDLTTSSIESRVLVPEGGGSGVGDNEILTRLLQTTFAEHSYTVTSFPVPKEFGTITVSLKFRDQNQYPFVTLVEEEEHIYMQIHQDQIPTRNTVIYVIAEFMFKGNHIQQEYGFTIPGIYREQSMFPSSYHFDDNLLYQYLISISKVDPQYSALDDLNLFLLEDEIQSIEELTLPTDLNIQSVLGIGTLRNLKLLDLSYHLLLPKAEGRLEPLRGLGIERLYLTNMQLSNADLAVFPSLNELYYLTLSHNLISNFLQLNGEIWFYRQLKLLDIAYNQLTEIVGIEQLPFLETLFLNNNEIGLFESLVNLPKIRDIYLGGNRIANSTLAGLYRSGSTTPTEFITAETNKRKNALGTNGVLNESYYVALLDEGVNLYRDAQTKISLDADRIKYYRQLNSIILPSAYYYNVVQSEYETARLSHLFRTDLWGGGDGLRVLFASRPYTVQLRPYNQGNEQIVKVNNTSTSSIFIIVNVSTEWNHNNLDISRNAYKLFRYDLHVEVEQ